MAIEPHFLSILSGFLLSLIGLGGVLKKEIYFAGKGTKAKLILKGKSAQVIGMILFGIGIMFLVFGLKH